MGAAIRESLPARAPAMIVASASDAAALGGPARAIEFQLLLGHWQAIVLPENLGSIEPEPFFQFPMRFPEDSLGDAQRVRVVRDGFASFYFHPFLDIGYLQQTVEGLQGAGWTFVSPASL